SIMETCVDLAPDGWHDVFCGFPLNGNLVGHANSTPRAYICEHTCGNGTIDPGEQCDPPGGDCTPACLREAPCTEANGQIAALTGHCFFPAGTSAAYNAQTTAAQCPTGTHLGAPQTPDENAAALASAIARGSALWIALRAPTTLGVFQWDVTG